MRPTVTFIKFNNLGESKREKTGELSVVCFMSVAVMCSRFNLT